MITPEQLRVAAEKVLLRYPDGAVLVRNDVGNLAVGFEGEYVGWIDLGDGDVGWLADD